MQRAAVDLQKVLVLRLVHQGRLDVVVAIYRLAILVVFELVEPRVVKPVWWMGGLDFDCNVGGEMPLR